MNKRIKKKKRKKYEKKLEKELSSLIIEIGYKRKSFITISDYRKYIPDFHKQIFKYCIYGRFLDYIIVKDHKCNEVAKFYNKYKKY